MKFKLACADYAFPLLPHDQVFDLIAMLGASGVNIGLFPNRSHFQPNDFLDDLPGAARELSAKVHDRGLVIADIFLISGTDLMDQAENHPKANQRQKSRDLFQRTLEFVVRCNATHLTTLPGIAWKGEPLEDSLKRCSEELAWRVEQTSEMGVVFSIEPHMWSVVQHPDDAKRLVEMTPGLTLALDFGHFAGQGITEESYLPLLPFMSHFHARCAAKGKVQTSMRSNTINWAAVVQETKRIGYQGFYCLEYVVMQDESVDIVDNLSETILLRDVLIEAANKTS